MRVFQILERWKDGEIMSCKKICIVMVLLIAVAGTFTAFRMRGASSMQETEATTRPPDAVYDPEKDVLNMKIGGRDESKKTIILKAKDTSSADTVGYRDSRQCI